MDLASKDAYIQKLASKVFSQREQEPKKRPFGMLAHCFSLFTPYNGAFVCAVTVHSVCSFNVDVLGVVEKHLNLCMSSNMWLQLLTKGGAAL